MGDLKTWCVVFREKSFDDFLFCCPIAVLNIFCFFVISQLKLVQS